MNAWNFDISAAPRGKYVLQHRKFGKGEGETKVFVPDRVILASKCGKVTVSHWLPEEGRWEMFAKGEDPIAWQPWPEHPGMVPPPPMVERTDLFQ